MHVRRISLTNFRGIRSGQVVLGRHALLVGGNAAGKSTVCEALDLVLGSERLYRRPVIDEYDFFQGTYRADPFAEPEAAATHELGPLVKVEAVLTDLDATALRRFHAHLRPWDPMTNDFADPADESAPDLVAGGWCLPVVFLGRFDSIEDDFEGATFFAHPPPRQTLDPTDDGLGAGLKTFTRDDKRLCGFVYLRPHRTGNRALSFNRGSLIDTILRLHPDKTGSPWTSALDALAGLDVSTADAGFGAVRDEIYPRVARFLSLAASDSPISVQPSDLTREHLREVLRLFVATQPGTYAVPVNRLSTGAANVLVFALLTYIADLRGPDSVIFAMEEPEIALPPHTQRRMVDFIASTMGQAIVTSHSPYVIERFDASSIVLLRRDDTGQLETSTIDLGQDLKPRRYRDQRRQFAEAVLAKAVLVVEGATEVEVYRAVADALDADPSTSYQHPDLVGLSLFNAGNDVSVASYAPVFAGIGKIVFGTHDQIDLTADQQAKTGQFAIYRPIPYGGIEDLLTTEIQMTALQHFLDAVQSRADYPLHCGALGDDPTEADIVDLAGKVLKARKGADGYAPLLIAACEPDELPATLTKLLLDIDRQLTAPQAVKPANHDDSVTSPDLRIDEPNGP